MNKSLKSAGSQKCMVYIPRHIHCTNYIVRCNIFSRRNHHRVTTPTTRILSHSSSFSPRPLGNVVPATRAYKLSCASCQKSFTAAARCREVRKTKSLTAEKVQTLPDAFALANPMPEHSLVLPWQNYSPLQFLKTIWRLAQLLATYFSLSSRVWDERPLS